MNPEYRHGLFAVCLASNHLLQLLNSDTMSFCSEGYILISHFDINSCVQRSISLCIFWKLIGMICIADKLRASDIVGKIFVLDVPIASDIRTNKTEKSAL